MLAMALREFSDRNRRQWRAWDITPDEIHPGTRDEEYLHGFLEGWLVFQTADGREKRRLRPIPPNWVELSDAELERLLRSAEPVRLGGKGAHAGDATRQRGATDLEEQPEIATAAPAGGTTTTRTFLYPGGRFWSVREQRVQLRDETGEPREERTVLRFAAGARVLDLRTWPREWTGYTEEQLADLLFRGFPRQPGAPNPTNHRRRRDDRQEREERADPGRPAAP